jgi:hypothetical protein
MSVITCQFCGGVMCDQIPGGTHTCTDISNHRQSTRPTEIVFHHPYPDDCYIKIDPEIVRKIDRILELLEQK